MTKTVSIQELTALGNNDDPRLECIYYAQQLINMEHLITQKNPLLMRSLFARLKMFLAILKQSEGRHTMRNAITNTQYYILKIENAYVN
jgi:hypothetical protein